MPQLHESQIITEFLIVTLLMREKESERRRDRERKREGEK